MPSQQFASAKKRVGSSSTFFSIDNSESQSKLCQQTVVVAQCGFSAQMEINRNSQQRKNSIRANKFVEWKSAAFMVVHLKSTD